ncbi:hypothetical protein PLESTB_001048000 [Pleodorina starrii]|uniref:Uncharacterized protein n=1 Tax=Pleodorina starrii TaxID=330485 RepID=A0A9W6F493_9CHLO|nr:hypothetical protein PLESTB_001048000 [Pleodorina starrii]
MAIHRPASLLRRCAVPVPGLPLLLPLVILAILAILLPRGLARRLPLQDSDLVLVRGTCTSRLDLAHATGRAARTNSTSLRAVYVLEDETQAQELQQRFGAPLNETYLAWPDRPDPKKPGDTRVALAPWLAHRALGESYKWLLYGDDDTFFFVENVKALLQEYDPDLPYIVTDALWHKRKRNLMEAPRCLPCHLSLAYRQAVSERPDRDPGALAAPPPRGGGAGGGGGGSGGSSSQSVAVAPVPPPGCPCTPQLACDFTLNMTGKRKAARSRTRPLVWSPESKMWGFPPDYPTACDYPHFHGGSGVLISVGAMRQVPYSAALSCFYDDVRKRFARPESLKERAHGDRMTSLCFWLHGVAPTDPGLSLSKHEATYIGGRVMDARTANLGSIEKAIKGELPNPSHLWVRGVIKSE